MRNVFDQYNQPENRLTHALVCTLARDPRLLQQFSVRWATGRPAPVGALRIVEQQLPGESEVSEELAERRGIPDAWIYTDAGWALLIESKVGARVSLDQVCRHLATAHRHGFENPVLLLLTARGARPIEGDGVLAKTWSDLYVWLCKECSGSDWARTLTDYLAIAEARLVADEYLTAGALTVFAGIHFSTESPYSYIEAKRLLRLVTDELRERKELVKHLGMDPNGEGRSAITGVGGSNVWDFLSLKAARGLNQFTNAPHLTVSIQDKRLWVAITVPNGVKPIWRKRLRDLDEREFSALLASVNKALVRALRGARGAVPWVEIIQRHYPSQRSQGIVDARLEFDLRTAFETKGEVKLQPEWLAATHHAFAKRRSNVQLMVGAMFLYDQCAAVRSRKILDHIADTWLACKPMLDVMFGADARTR